MLSINPLLSPLHFYLLIVIEKRVILDDAWCFVFPIIILSFYNVCTSWSMIIDKISKLYYIFTLFLLQSSIACASEGG